MTVLILVTDKLGNMSEYEIAKLSASVTLGGSDKSSTLHYSPKFKVA